MWLMLPCGSASISSTRLPRPASPAAMWREVVVLPTPPFMFSTEIVRICFHMLHTRARSGPYAVMIAVTVVRYAACSYAPSISSIRTTVVASDFASN